MWSFLSTDTKSNYKLNLKNHTFELRVENTIHLFSIHGNKKNGKNVGWVNMATDVLSINNPIQFTTDQN